MIDAALAACAPHVSPVTLAAIIRVESAGRPLAININKGPRVPPARTATEAATVARSWIARGYSVDLGLMQVNSRNLARLGVSVEQMFEPCANIAAGAYIHSNNYRAAAKVRGDGQHALRDALSAYNTGDFRRGYTNGYVEKYYNMTYSNIRIAPPISGSAVAVADPFSAETSVFSRKDVSNDAIGSAAGSTAPAYRLD